MQRIVYDYQTFSLQQFGGISRYFCELAQRIHASPRFDARVVAPVHYNDYLPLCPVPQSAWHIPMRIPRTGRLYRGINRLLGPALVAAARPSLVHHTYYAPLRTPGRIPSVVTVFDMIHELFPEHFPPGDPTSAQKRTAVTRASHVICISESTARDLIRLFDVPRSKVSVTYLGFSAAFATSRGRTRRPHERPYLLYVGQRGGYKNFESMVVAYAQSAQLRDSFDILAFGGFPFDEAERELFRRLGLRADSVRRATGTDDDLAAAYAHAHAFVYPSRYEGFGIPPLEAMSCACPVLCADASSIPEVVGDAAEMFDPNSPESMRDAMERVAFDESRRLALIAAGAQRVARFSWQRCADETMHAYDLALSQH